MQINISTNDSVKEDEVLLLYRLNKWSAAEKPKELMAALRNSHALVTARISGALVGIGNAISDGHLVVYYPHLLVHPEYQGNGIGRKMMEAMSSIYGQLHMQMLTADGESVNFYNAIGFERAGKTVPMWIYGGDEH